MNRRVGIIAVLILFCVTIGLLLTNKGSIQNMSQTGHSLTNKESPRTPKMAMLHQNATFPAEGQALLRQTAYNLSAGLRDDANWNRTFNGGYLAVNQSGSAFSNTTLTPMGTFRGSYSSFDGVNDSIGGAPYNFTTTITGGTGSAQINQAYRGHDRVLNVTTGTSTSTYVTNTKDTTGWPVLNVSVWFNIPVMPTSLDTFEPLSVFGPGGESSVWTNIYNGNLCTLGNATVICPVSANTWNYIMYEINMPAGQFNVWLNGVKHGPYGTFAARTNNIAQSYTPDISVASFTAYIDGFDWSVLAGSKYIAPGVQSNAIDSSQLGNYNGTQSFDQFAPFVSLANATATYPPQTIAPFGSTYGCVVSATNQIYVAPNVANASTSHKNVLYTLSNGTGGAYFYYGLGGNAASTTLEFWAYPGSVLNSGDWAYAMVYDQFAQYGGNIIVGGFEGFHKTLTLWNGATGVQVMPFSNNTWYHIRYVINWGAKTYDAYVNGTLQESGFAFNNASAKGVNTLMLGTYSSSDRVDAYWDAIDCSNDPSYMLERSSYMLLQQNATFSTPGSYSFQFTLNSSGTNFPGNWTDFTIINPILLSQPSNATIAYGQVGNSISWTVIDTFNTSDYYAIDNNGSLSSQGNWTSGISFGISLNGLALGFYNFSCWAFDGYGQNITWAWIIVDDVPLVSSNPSAINALNGTTGLNINWTITDTVYNSINSIYCVYRNSIQNSTGLWSSGTIISVSIDSPIIAGTYNWTIVVSDGYGLNTSNEVDVIASANPPPTIQANVSIYSYLVGTVGHGIQWNITDPVTGGSPSFTIYCNEVGNQTGSWTNPALFNFTIDNWGLGYYNVTLVANNGQGATSQQQVNVTVYDMPQITPPPFLSYYFNQTGFQLSWNATAIVYGITFYNISRNGTTVVIGSWVPGTNIIISGGFVDGLGIGTYNYSCMVSDGLGGSNASWILVSVLYHSVGITSSTPTYIYMVGATGNNLYWTISDPATTSPTYTIYRNGNPIQLGSWTSGAQVSCNIDGWVAGINNVTIVAYDGLGFSSQYLINVIVDDVPQFATPATAQTFYLGQNGYTLNWTVEDAIFTSLTYVITQNGTQVTSGTWSPAVPIYANLDGLAAGSFLFTCTVSDGYGASNSSSAIVTVISHAPTFGTPIIGTLEVGKPITVSVLVTDIVAVDQVTLIWTNDGGSTWNNVAMTGTLLGVITGTNTIAWNYTANIPAQTAGSNVLFRIYGKDIYGAVHEANNGGQYYPINVPGGGLDWWVWLAIIGAAAAVGIIGIAYAKSSKKTSGKAGQGREVSKAVTASPAPAAAAATETAGPMGIKSKGFATERPVLANLHGDETEGEDQPGVYTYRGGQIVGRKYIYKVKVKNATAESITDVSIHLLNYPRDSMTLSSEELRRVAKIEPHGFRSLEFELEPHNDCVEGQLVAAVNYMDSKNEFHALPVQPLALKSVCDLMGPLEMSEAEFDQLVAQWASTKEVFTFEGEDPRALLMDIPTILGSKNFYTVAGQEFPSGNMLNAEVKGIAIGKYTRKKLAIDVILEADTALGEGTVTCTGLAEDPSMLVACLQDVLGAFRKRLEQFWDTRVTRLRDVMNIQHVLVIHKESGTAIVSENYAGEKIDGNLISGFLTALTAFQGEIRGKKSAPNAKSGFTLDYADFKILLEDGEYIRAALILESDASDTIKERLARFIKRYESTYLKQLAAWRGNLDDVKGGEKYIEEIFEMSLLYPHTINTAVGANNLGKLGCAIYAMGQAITKEKSFFFLATLMEYAMTGLRETQDRIFSTIYDMKKNHAIEPMKEENKGTD